jgi:hypothetical protein
MYFRKLGSWLEKSRDSLKVLIDKLHVLELWLFYTTKSQPRRPFHGAGDVGKDDEEGVDV